MPRLSFGIKTSPQHTTYQAIQQVWREADAHPAFEHAWAFDHFAPLGGDLDGPCLEGWTLLAALAAQTQRLRVGLLVTGNTYRHPAVLANMAATVDIVSGGRLDFGIGAGWNEYEHRSMDIPLPPPGERLRRLDEACRLIKLLWTQPTTDFEGRHYHLRQARCEPKPVQKPHPPIVVGGKGEQLTLRVAARHADIWNYPGGSPEEFAHKVGVLHDHCRDVGRDPAEIRLSLQTRVDYDDLGATAALLRRYVEAGGTHLVLILVPPYPQGIVARLAEELLPQVAS